MATINVNVQLSPDYRRLVKSMKRLFEAAALRDAKKYLRGEPFLPIFPTDDTNLQNAITVVMNQLNYLLTP